MRDRNTIKQGNMSTNFVRGDRMRVEKVVKVFEEVYEVEEKREEVRQLFKSIFGLEPERFGVNKASKYVIIDDYELSARIDDIFKAVGLSPDCDYFEIGYVVKRTEFNKPEDFMKNFVQRTIDGREWYISTDFPEMIHLPKEGFVSKIEVYRNYGDDC